MSTANMWTPLWSESMKVKESILNEPYSCYFSLSRVGFKNSQSCDAGFDHVDIFILQESVKVIRLVTSAEERGTTSKNTWEWLTRN